MTLAGQILHVEAVERGRFESGGRKEFAQLRAMVNLVFHEPAEETVPAGKRGCG